MSPDANSKGVLAAALDYAARGWPVFPCKADKAPYTEHGFKDASCDEAVIREWWRQHPQAMGGIATGSAGLVVIDVDVKNGVDGMAAWQRLVDELGDELVETATVTTPSGGCHLYYRAEGLQVACSVGGLAEGIDVRGEGGYTIAPPSVNDDGVAYRWCESKGIEQLRELPVALAARLADLRRGEPHAQAAAGEEIPGGQRNVTLTSLAGSLRARGLSEDGLAAALVAENATRCKPPLPSDEVRRIAASIARYPAGEVGSTDLVPGSDSDSAERFIALFGDRVRYCALERCWYVYDGCRWQRDERLLVEDLMRQALRGVFEDASRARDDDAARAMARRGLRLQSAQARRAALECARSDPRIAVHPIDFDRHPNLLNCTNGTLDLVTGELRAHDPGDLIRQLAPVAYDPEARHEIWVRFLNEATGGDVDLQEYLQRAVGYSLTGETGERVFFLLLGPTGTGKSTFVEALLATLGDYAYPAGIEAFLRRTHVGGARPDIAALTGRRLVTGIEVDNERHLDEVLIKQIVGGDTISERDLYARAVPFVPQCTLWFAANEAPRMSDTDDALWVRLRAIPFTCQVPPERMDTNVKATLRDPGVAGPAILAWAVEGCLAWREVGLGSAPASISQETLALRLEMDPLRDFLDERCVFDGASFSSNKSLRDAYHAWLDQFGGVDRLGSKEWGERLQRRALKPGRPGGQRGYFGIRLRTERTEEP